MHITKKPWTDYLVTLYHFGNPQEHELYSVEMTRVFYSEEYCVKWMIPQLVSFSKHLKERIAPDKLDRERVKPPPVVRCVKYEIAEP
jgi:hypothetical protein